VGTLGTKWRKEFDWRGLRVTRNVTGLSDGVILIDPVRVSNRPNHNFGAADNREMDVGFVEFAEGGAQHTFSAAQSLPL
jgi:hypothetical protein